MSPNISDCLKKAIESTISSENTSELDSFIADCRKDIDTILLGELEQKLEDMVTGYIHMYDIGVTAGSAYRELSRKKKEVKDEFFRVFFGKDLYRNTVFQTLSHHIGEFLSSEDLGNPTFLTEQIARLKSWLKTSGFTIVCLGIGKSGYRYYSLVEEKNVHAIKQKFGAENPGLCLEKGTYAQILWEFLSSKKDGEKVSIDDMKDHFKKQGKDGIGTEDIGKARTRINKELSRLSDIKQVKSKGYKGNLVYWIENINE